MHSVYKCDILAYLTGRVRIISRAIIAWGTVDCCDLMDPTSFTSKPCIANCPIMGSSGLPANPWLAQIKGGKCECIAPQECSS
jgi:hypothetical protein